ncbi:hypothetical protein [Streptomyces griseus]|uniref:hypothetical protein n=1 Tax=Streptomyces griseus TaxID=1911 RepID=UPI00365D8485
MRETREELRSPTAAAVGEFAPNPEELADRWAALRTEWRRIAAHLTATGADVYNAALDETGSTWAWEREERHARVLRERGRSGSGRRATSCTPSSGWARRPGGGSVPWRRGPG